MLKIMHLRQLCRCRVTVIVVFDSGTICWLLQRVNFRKCFKRKLNAVNSWQLLAIIVFQYYNHDCDNVNADFPSNQVGGVSSAIVLGGKFDVFTKPNGSGVSSILTEGRYATATTMNIGNDRLQSIRKLQWTICRSSGRLDDLFAQA